MCIIRILEVQCEEKQQQQQQCAVMCPLLSPGPAAFIALFSFKYQSVDKYNVILWKVGMPNRKEHAMVLTVILEI